MFPVEAGVLEVLQKGCLRSAIAGMKIVPASSRNISHRSRHAQAGRVAQRLTRSHAESDRACGLPA